MTASSSRNLLMLTVIIGLYSVHLILGETTEVSINDKVQKFDHNQGANYANVVISKAKNVRATPEPKNTKTQKTFWSNVIPFYDTVKNHLSNQNKFSAYDGTNQSYSPNWWYNNNPDNKNLVRPHEEYYGNHLMTSAESPPLNSEDVKNTRYDSTGYPSPGNFPDNRQDYDEEMEPYIHSLEPTYSDNYSPPEEVPPERPAVYNFLRGPPQPVSRFPPVKMCPCNQVAGVRHIITTHQGPPMRQAGCFGGAFLGLLGTLAATVWSLLQIVLANALPFLIPVVLIKAAFIVFKVYKFIKTVKLVLKLVILLPFVLRVVMPMMQNMMNNQSIVHLLKMRHDDVLENRQSLLFWNIDDLMSAEEMTACASKTACEIGAFVAAKSLKHLPEKFSNTLKKRADLMEKKKSKTFRLVEQEVVNAFFTAFAKNWTHENCAVYPCSISL